MTLAVRSTNDKIDFALTALMAAIALSVSALLIADVNLFVRPANDHSERTQIASLAETAPGVRRRPHDLPVWDTARLAEPLFLNDFVFTDENASAKLAFLDESTVELGENTLVEVQQVEQNSILNVIKGSLRAKTGPGKAEILIRVGGRKEIIRSTGGAAFELTVQKGKPDVLKVLAGKAEIGASRIAVVANQAAMMAEDAPATVQALAVSLASPPHGATLKDPSTSGVELVWIGNERQFHVEVARDQSFQNIVKDLSATGNSIMTGALPAGTYFWKVGDSEHRKFTIDVARGPSLYLPADGQTVSDLSPSLGWEALRDARSYEVEVANDREFNQLVWSGKSVTPQQRAGAMKDGSYYWRVKAAGAPLWSSVARFDVKAEVVAPVPPPSPKGKLNAPVLPKHYDIELPQNEKRGTPWHWLKTLVEATAYAAEAAKVLSWGIVEGARGYVVEIAADPTFAQKLVTERVTTPEWQIHDLNAGTYYLRVAGIDEAGEAGAFSEASQVVVTKASVAAEPGPALAAPPKPLAAPVLLAPVDGEKVTLTGLLPVVSFAWKGVSGAAAYAFQVAADDDFKDVVFEKKTRGLDVGAELKPHVYFWRMRSLRTASDPGAWSKANRFEVIHTVPGKPEPEPPPPQPPPSLTELVPKLKPEHGRFSAAFAPSRYRYESTGSDPETKIDARLFNSQALAGTVSLRPGLALEGGFRRTATVLFRNSEGDDPQGQSALKIAPYLAQLSARWRLGDDLTPWAPFLDLAPGYQSLGVVHFSRNADQTIDAKTRRVQGPMLTLAGGVRVDQTFGFRLGASGSAHGYRIFALANRDFATPGLGVEFGLETSKEKTEVTVLTQTLILGLGYNY